MPRVNDAKACLIISKLNDLLEKLDIPIVKNKNISVDHLECKNLHLSPYGMARFTTKLKASIRKL